MQINFSRHCFTAALCTCLALPLFTQAETPQALPTRDDAIARVKLAVRYFKEKRQRKSHHRIQQSQKPI